jgi:peptidoglycan/LPS O-acetylase OafA/YrhL
MQYIEDFNVLFYVFVSVFLTLAASMGVAWLIWHRVQKLKRRMRRKKRTRRGVEDFPAVVED